MLENQTPYFCSRLPLSLTNPTFTEHTDNTRATDVPKVADVGAD